MSEITNVAVDGFAAETGTIPVVGNLGVDAPTATTVKTSTQKFYTEEDLAKVRSQEKEKLYPQIDSLKAEIDALKKDREERNAARAAKADAKEAEKAQKKQQAIVEQELSAKELLALKEQEWKSELERERQERELAFSLLEKERSLADLQAYRNQRVEQERDSIVPELIDLVIGNTREEVEASINDLKGRSQSILDHARATRESARREMTGTRVTTPPAGPLETDSEQRQLTSAEIANMSMSDYAKYRSRLLSPQAQGRTQGMFS
jgi:DNA repair exonuclease SbcCD ATPase subunit